MTPGYEAYLRSPHWLYIRDAKLGYSNYTCADCGYRRFPYKWGMPKRLEVHHLTYERLGREKLADLGRPLRRLPRGATRPPAGPAAHRRNVVAHQRAP